jgi:ABC-type uncharacterized transport system permease subunit
MDRRVKIAIVITSTIVLVTSVGIYLYVKNLSPIPNSITIQLNFKPVVAGAQKTITDINFNPDSKILTYNQQFGDFKLLISQQSAPDDYIDFPEKLKLTVQQMGLEQEFKTNKGQVYIVKNDGKQTAVSLQGSVLVLVQADQQMSAEQWTEFINSLKSVR